MRYFLQNSLKLIYIYHVLKHKKQHALKTSLKMLFDYARFYLEKSL